MEEQVFIICKKKPHESARPPYSIVGAVYKEEDAVKACFDNRFFYFVAPVKDFIFPKEEASK